MLIFNEFHKPLVYKEYDGLSDNNTPLHLPARYVQGLRIKGQTKVVHTKDGDEVTCTIVYRTDEKLVPNSILEGHVIMESVEINALDMDTGYLNYVK